MRTGSERSRLFWFVGCLALVAFTINCVVYAWLHPHRPFIEAIPTPNQPAERESQVNSAELAVRKAEADALALQAREEARKAAEAAAAHEKFLGKYLNADFVKKTGIRQVALVAASESGQLDHALAGALAPHFQSPSVEITSTLFKPAFVSDKFFDKVFAGSTDPLYELDLGSTLNSVILARETVSYSKDPSLLNLISANVQIDVTLLPVTGSGQSRGWKFASNGAGFKQPEARQAALERLFKKISSDTNMSFNSP